MTQKLQNIKEFHTEDSLTFEHNKKSLKTEEIIRQRLNEAYDIDYIYNLTHPLGEDEVFRMLFGVDIEDFFATLPDKDEQYNDDHNTDAFRWYLDNRNKKEEKNKQTLTNTNKNINVRV